MKKAIKQSALMGILNICSILLLIGVAGSFIYTTVCNKSVDTANQNRTDLNANATRFLNGSAYLTDEVRAYAVTGNQQRHDNYFNEINVLKNRDIGLENMRAIGITPEEEAMITEMSAISNRLVPLEEAAMQQVQAGHSESAIEYVYGSSYSADLAEIKEIQQLFLSTITQRCQDTISGYQRSVGISSIITFIFIAAICGMQVCTIFITRRRIIKPIIAVEHEMMQLAAGNLNVETDLEPDTSELGMLIHSLLTTRSSLKQYIGDISEKLSAMAKGNMDLEIDQEYVGDFAPIKEAMSTILQALNGTLHEISVVADQVATGSEQLSSGAQALAQGATEQASSVEELTSTIHEISSQVEVNANSAGAAKEKSFANGDEVIDSNSQMEEMIVAMHEISNKSNEIQRIMKTIDEISLQTNLLALNAAVEAARAGVAGKGFAVVSDEVRNLAGKSAEAAKETAVLIQEAIAAIQTGTQLADRTAQSLRIVVDGTAGVTGLIDNIAIATSEQAAAIGQVNIGMDQIAMVVQTNSATAEQSAAASVELHTQAQTLKALVGQFRLRNQSHFQVETHMQ